MMQPTVNRLYLFACVVWFLAASGLPPAAPANEERIVSLAPSNTAMASELQLDDWLVGITTHCVRPANATDAVVIGTITQPNLEQIVSLKPTLVLADRDNNPRDSVEQMEQLGIRVLKLGPADSLETIIRDYRSIAAATGRTDFAEAEVARFHKELAAITDPLQDVRRPRVFVEIWPDPLMTISDSTYIHDMVERAGGQNPFADTSSAYPRISMESVLAVRPDVILILTHSLIDDSRLDTYRQFPSLSETAIHQVDAASVSQPSLDNMLDAVHRFAELIHPTTAPLSPEAP